MPLKKKGLLLVIAALAAMVSALAVGIAIFSTMDAGNKDPVSGANAPDGEDTEETVLGGEDTEETVLGGEDTNEDVGISQSPEPSEAPSFVVTLTPTESASSVAPSDIVLIPSSTPSWVSNLPSGSPSTRMPSRLPSLRPSLAPSSLPTVADWHEDPVTVFYAIGDVPYTNQEADELVQQMLTIPDDAEFVIHVGDIRSAEDGKRCRQSEYDDVAETLRLSRAPVFMVLGDNEWNDCRNVDEGWDIWHEVFGEFDRQWNHSFDVIRPVNRTENFAFVHKRTLFIGLNIVGGRVHDAAEWEERHVALLNWTQELIVNNTMQGRRSPARSVVIFAHANPTLDHAMFFDGLRTFVNETINNRVPILYLNGDAHHWLYEPSFLGQPSFLRIMVAGGTRQPPLKVSVNSTLVTSTINTSQTFVYDRQFV